MPRGIIDKHSMKRIQHFNALISLEYFFFGGSVFFFTAPALFASSIPFSAAASGAGDLV